jgi:hypothetical protein
MPLPYFISRRALHLMCQSLRRRETLSESLLSASKSPDDGHLLTLRRSNKTVYSAERAYIYVGGRSSCAAADGVGNNRPDAGSCPGRRGDHVSLARFLLSLRIKSSHSKMPRTSPWSLIPTRLQICIRKFCLDKIVSHTFPFYLACYPKRRSAPHTPSWNSEIENFQSALRR